MRRVVAWSLLVLLAGPALAGCTIPGRDREWRLDITLGVLLAETGGYSLLDVGDAVNLAASEAENAGYGVRMTVVREAAGSNAVAAFDQLAGRGAAAIIAAVPPSEAQALAARAASQRQVLLLATPAAAPLTGDLAYTLQLGQDPRAVGRALAALAEREGVERPFLLRPTDPFAALTAEGFRGAFNGTMAAEREHRIGVQSDVINVAREACTAQADALVILSRADEAGWAIRAVHDAGCLPQLRVLAGPSARQQDLVVEAGRDLNNNPIAAGVLGIEPDKARLSAFRSLFATESDRAPGPYAAEAYDATVYVVLSAFASKAQPREPGVRAIIGSADLQPQLLRVADEPGIEHTDLGRAVEAVKATDEIDWAGFAHDDGFTTARQPQAATYAIWRVTTTGGLESTRQTVAA